MKKIKYYYCQPLIIVLIIVLSTSFLFAGYFVKSREDIKLGMSTEEVSDTWGSPDNVDRTTFGPGVTEVWIYEDREHGKRYKVSFKNTLVVAVDEENIKSLEPKVSIWQKIFPWWKKSKPVKPLEGPQAPPRVRPPVRRHH